MTIRPINLCILLARAGHVHAALRYQAGSEDEWNHQLFLICQGMIEEARKMAEELNREDHEGGHP